MIFRDQWSISVLLRARHGQKEKGKSTMSADIVVVFNKAYQVYGYYKTLKSFVENEMGTFLQKMGEIQFSSAIQHLENATRSSERRNDYILIAIGDLENAYREFEASAPSGFKRFLRENVRGLRGLEEKGASLQ